MRGLVDTSSECVARPFFLPIKPCEGFEYLYLTEEDYKDLPNGAVMGEWTEVGFALKAVVGLGLSRLDSIHGYGSKM